MVGSRNFEVKWNEIAPLPVGRSAHTAVLLHGSVYVGGGAEGTGIRDYKHSFHVNVYNLSTNQWSASSIIAPYSSFAMTVVDNKLLIAGGWTKDYNATNVVLSLSGGQWITYSEMPTARHSLTAVGHSSMLITVGGRAQLKNTWVRLAITELLDTTNGHWFTCRSLPVPQSQLKSAIVNNTLYLLGGLRDDKPSPQVFAASLDNLSNHQLEWQFLSDCPCCYSAPAILYDKFLLTFGGRQAHGRVNKVCNFNISTGSWMQIHNIPEARSFVAAVSVADNKIIVLGGTNNQGDYPIKAWVGVFE